MKKIWNLSVVVASTILVVGCGGGSSSSDVEIDSVETGKAYYLDSAVAGVNYKCGNQEGITGANGEFVFEKGQSCTFYLGDVKLRDMDKALLKDGAKIVEDDIQIATLLQSLDVDGNPDNGITLTPEVVEAVVATLQEDGESKLPSTPEEIEALVASVENNVTTFGGHVVTESEAQTHLTQTQTEATKALFAGKTLYAYWEEDGEKYVAEVTINADVTSWQYQMILGGSGSGTEGLVVSGDVLSIDHPEEDELDPYKVLAKDQYVELRNINDDSVLYFYYDKVDAESAFNAGTSSSGDEEPITKFSTEWLDGKTLYFVQYDDFGYDGEDEPGMQWNMARMDFTENTMSWTEYDLPDTSTHTFNYSITSDGKIDIGGDFNEVIEFQSQTDDYIKVCEDGDCNTYLFFDESKARAFRDSQNN